MTVKNENKKPKWPYSLGEEEKYQSQMVEYVDTNNAQLLKNLLKPDGSSNVEEEKRKNVPGWLTPLVAGVYVPRDEMIYILHFLGKYSKPVASTATVAAVAFKIADLLTLETQKELKIGEGLTEIITIASEGLSGYSKEDPEEIGKQIDTVENAYKGDFGYTLKNEKGEYNLELTLLITTFYVIYTTYLSLIICITIGAYDKVQNIKREQAQNVVKVLTNSDYSEYPMKNIFNVPDEQTEIQNLEDTTEDLRSQAEAILNKQTKAQAKKTRQKKEKKAKKPRKKRPKLTDEEKAQRQASRELASEIRGLMGKSRRRKSKKNEAKAPEVKVPELTAEQKTQQKAAQQAMTDLSKTVNSLLTENDKTAVHKKRF